MYRVIAQGDAWSTKTAEDLQPHQMAPSTTTIPTEEALGQSEPFLAFQERLSRVAPIDRPVLLMGERGTGKELAATRLHYLSRRWDGPLVSLNAAALSPSLIEAELFGHEKGAFTGAQARKAGKFELADEGTVFLDEVGELAPALQAKLLRALQERVVERVGGSEPVPVTARVVAATNRDLLAEAAAGRFREDLVYRLDVIHIRMPPLRERREDIPLLVEGLLGRIAERAGIALPRLTQAALDRLCAHDWPGNVRELENLLTQAAVRARNELITPDLLGIAQGSAAQQGPKEASASGSADAGETLQSLDAVEAAHIQRVLDHTGGHKGRSCEILGISRPALDRKIQKYGLRVPGRD